MMGSFPQHRDLCNGGIQTPDSSPQGSPEPYSTLVKVESKTQNKPSGTGNCIGSLPTPEMSPMDQEDTQAEEQQQRHGAVFQLVNKFSLASDFLRSVSHPYRPTMMGGSVDSQQQAETSGSGHPYASHGTQFFNSPQQANNHPAGSYYNPAQQSTYMSQSGYNESCAEYGTQREFNRCEDGKF